MSIKWTGGSPEAAINKVVLPQLKENLAAQLREVRCPEHGSTPTTVTITGEKMDSLLLHVTGCCDKLTEAVRNAFR